MYGCIEHISECLCPWVGIVFSTVALSAHGRACLSFGSRQEGALREPFEDLQANAPSTREPFREGHMDIPGRAD